MGDFVVYGLGRWLHIMAGVMWIGLLYYFNFVQVDALKAAAADQPPTGAGITKHVAPRALFFFRWAAVVTVLAGAMILFYRPFNRGSRITVSGYDGVVTQIDLRYTRLRTKAADVLLPNSTLLTNPITVHDREAVGLMTKHQ